MRNKILALLAVAAVGSVAAAQQTQAVDTEVVVVNEFTEPADVALVINTPDTSLEITTTTNDGSPHNISVVADGWTFAPAVVATPATGYPALSIFTPDGAGPLISITNAVEAPVVVVAGATNVFEDVTVVTLIATVAEVKTLAAGEYATVLTYTMN